jgi:hypothetical protein
MKKNRAVRWAHRSAVSKLEGKETAKNDTMKGRSFLSEA